MNWRTQLKRSIRTVDGLKNHIPLAAKEEAILRKVTDIHPMCVPPYYMSLIEPGNPDDPIRKMSVPSAGELLAKGTYDTSGEKENTRLVGLQHKYRQTALILATNICPMYCRHCFRKRMVGISDNEQIRQMDAAIAYIRTHPRINNVLISGGDPLMLATGLLKKIIARLSAIPHISFIRIGSRMPVTLPQRICQDEGLLETFERYSTKDRRLYLVTQFNHPREITPESVDAVDRLIRAGMVVNNQSVLLKGVNDDPKVLSDLLNGLAAIGVNPYYVFQCRPVSRVVHHFQVSLVRGNQVIERAKALCSGIGKRFKYVMSHRTGKVEIIGLKDGHIFLKYHQAKDPSMLGRLLRLPVSVSAGWLDDLLPADLEKEAPPRRHRLPSYSGRLDYGLMS